MAKKKLSEYERFMALSDEEKNAEVAVFDHPLPVGKDGLPGRPLNAKERALWKRVQRRLQRGRPKIGRGVKRVMVSVEAGLLQRADAYARKNHMKRSELIAKAIETIMSKAS
jgi:hypothetical protein